MQLGVDDRSGMPRVVFDIRISPEEFQRLYAGSAKTVACRSEDGRRVRFPASILRRFVTREGVKGRFSVEFSDDNRFVSIERL